MTLKLACLHTALYICKVIKIWILSIFSRQAVFLRKHKMRVLRSNIWILGIYRAQSTSVKRFTKR